MKGESRLVQVDDWQLVLLIMNRLWRMYDSGGVSVGRSLRASLLESITGLTRISDYCNHEYEIDDFIVEAKMRQGTKYSGQLFLDLGLAGVPNQLFFRFLVREMKLWYQDDMRTNKFPLDYERKIVDTMYELLCCNDYLQQFDKADIIYTKEELLQEAENRSYTRFLYDSGLYEYLVINDDWID